MVLRIEYSRTPSLIIQLIAVQIRPMIINMSTVLIEIKCLICSIRFADTVRNQIPIEKKQIDTELKPGMNG